MRIDRFVLDTNIWVSYLITKKEQKLIDIIGDNALPGIRVANYMRRLQRFYNTHTFKNTR